MHIDRQGRIPRARLSSEATPLDHWAFQLDEGLVRRDQSSLVTKCQLTQQRYRTSQEDAAARNRSEPRFCESGASLTPWFPQLQRCAPYRSQPDPRVRVQLFSVPVTPRARATIPKEGTQTDTGASA